MLIPLIYSGGIHQNKFVTIACTYDKVGFFGKNIITNKKDGLTMVKPEYKVFEIRIYKNFVVYLTMFYDDELIIKLYTNKFKKFYTYNFNVDFHDWLEFEFKENKYNEILIRRLYLAKLI